MTDSATSTHSHYESLFTIICATILVGTETLGAGFATGWAIGGMLGLNPTLQLASQLVFSAIGLALMLLFFRNACRNRLGRARRA